MPGVTWRKASQRLIDLFDAVVPEDAGVTRKKMFGYPCAFKDGNMFMGLHQENMFLRLSNEDRVAFLKADQTCQFEPIPGRVMREYVVIPSWMLKNVEELKEWISKSLSYAASLPPNLRKTRKRADRRTYVNGTARAFFPGCTDRNFVAGHIPVL